jgi:hypothetical protein
MARATKSRKSWVERRADRRVAEVKTAPKDFADIKAGQRMVLPMPRDIEAAVRKVKYGSSLDMRELRSTLAKKYMADIACPVVTGIQLRTLAEAVGEQLDQGISPTDLPPVWRAMPLDAPIWRKLENGKAKLLALRHGEELDE